MNTFGVTGALCPECRHPMRLHRVAGCSVRSGVCFCDWTAADFTPTPLPALALVAPARVLTPVGSARVSAPADSSRERPRMAAPRPVRCLRCDLVLAECTCHDEWLAVHDV